jgi:APA family basic amino acid/polyamine antiporter
MKCMYYVTCIAALTGILTSLLVGLYGTARIVMVAARDWLLPPFLATIYPRTQTPLIAQICIGVVIGETLE